MVEPPQKSPQTAMRAAARAMQSMPRGLPTKARPQRCADTKVGSAASAAGSRTKGAMSSRHDAKSCAATAARN